MYLYIMQSLHRVNNKTAEKKFILITPGRCRATAAAANNQNNCTGLDRGAAAGAKKYPAASRVSLKIVRIESALGFVQEVNPRS